MNANLLNFPQNPSGKFTRQEDLEEVYFRKGVDFDDVIRDAHDLTLRNASERDPNYKGRAYMATNMNWNLLGILKDRYSSEIFYDEEKRLFFRLAPDVRLYFKKLDKKGRPSNIPTKHVLKLNSYQGSFFSNPTTILYAGYQLKQERIWDEIDCFLVEMRGLKMVDWKTSLSDLSARIAAKKVVHMPPVEKAIGDLEIRLRKQPGMEGLSSDQQTE